MEKKWNFAKAEPRWKYHHLFYSAVNGTRHLLAVPLHPVSLFAGIALNLPNVTWERAKERKAKEGRGEEEKKRENGEKKGGREPRPINRSGSNFSREARDPCTGKGARKNVTRRDAGKRRSIARVHEPWYIHSLPYLRIDEQIYRLSVPPYERSTINCSGVEVRWKLPNFARFNASLRTLYS